MLFGNSVSAQGTETGETLLKEPVEPVLSDTSTPINFGRIFCSKLTGVCAQYTATFNLYDRFSFSRSRQ